MNRENVNFSEKDILIVDDMPDNVRVLSAMLKKQGCTVRKALDGQMALTVCQTVLPDLILLDIMMPDLDGYEVCRRLKASEKTRDVPVIFISALDEVLDKVKAFNVGGVDYITKPFQVEEVLARICNQLTIQQLQRQLVEKNERLELLNEEMGQANAELKRLYSRVEEQNVQLQLLNEELTRSNTELEQFAYIASHDLQSPLQAVIGYAELLSWKYDSILNDDAEHFLREIVNGGLRMKQLIQDLLAYSKVGRGTLELEATNCETVLKEAIANLHQEISSSGAAVTHAHLPKVMGDRTFLMQLFQNLISNAIKFRQPEIPPQITISARPHDDSQWLFAVRDNGIGIHPQHLELIFQAFERVHVYKDYPGTGLGLAICKKIVERHGGQIWVESELGVGTTFYFTLVFITL